MFKTNFRQLVKKRIAIPDRVQIAPLLDIKMNEQKKIDFDKEVVPNTIVVYSRSSGRIATQLTALCHNVIRQTTTGNK
jgi:hypothetical protein